MPDRARKSPACWPAGRQPRRAVARGAAPGPMGTVPAAERGREPQGRRPLRAPSPGQPHERLTYRKKPGGWVVAVRGVRAPARRSARIRSGRQFASECVTWEVAANNRATLLPARPSGPHNAHRRGPMRKTQKTTALTAGGAASLSATERLIGSGEEPRAAAGRAAMTRRVKTRRRRSWRRRGWPPARRRSPAAVGGLKPTHLVYSVPRWSAMRNHIEKHKGRQKNVRRRPSARLWGRWGDARRETHDASPA